MQMVSDVRLMESNFDSNLCILSRGVLPTVKYPAPLPISTSMISIKNRFGLCTIFS